MFTVIIVVCSLKSMCIPSFVLIGCCVSELHGQICPYRNVWPEKIVACSQPYLAVAFCIYSFWHGVIPTSYFICNDFYTCFTHFSLTVSISTNRGLPSPSTDRGWGIPTRISLARTLYIRSCARSISKNTHARNRTHDS